MLSSIFKYGASSITRTSTIVAKPTTTSVLYSINNPTNSHLLNSGLQSVATIQPLWNPLGILSQRRFKSRGNTYQPSTLKRKRKFGFFARAKDRLKSRILKNRRDKGRWYLTH